MDARDAAHIDGNGVAGLLEEIGDAEMTSMLRTCQSCGTRRMIGEHHAYRGAGVVLRCPACHAIAAVVGVHERRLVVQWHGVYAVDR